MTHWLRLVSYFIEKNNWTAPSRKRLLINNAKYFLAHLRSVNTWALTARTINVMLKNGNNNNLKKKKYNFFFGFMFKHLLQRQFNSVYLYLYELYEHVCTVISEERMAAVVNQYWRSANCCCVFRKSWQ